MNKKKMITTVNEMKSNNIKQTMLIAVIVAAIIVSFSLVFMKFLFDFWVYTNSVLSAQRASQSALRDNIEIYEDLYIEYRDLQAAEGTTQDPNDETVLDALPRNYDFPALASSVQKIATSSGVRLKGFFGTDEEGSAPEPSHAPEPYAVVFTATVEGDYENIQVFINTLDLSVRPFEVIKAELSGSDDQLEAEVVLRTYFQPTQTVDYPERIIQ